MSTTSTANDQRTLVADRVAPQNVGDLLQSTPINQRLKGDTDEAIRFLKALDANGRHNLWALDPESGFNEGRTFEPNSWGAIRKWIDARLGRRNIYFSVNEPKPGIHKKLEKSDIARVRAVHLDIDAPKDERQDPESLIRLKAGLIATINAIQVDASAPEISVIIDSGGGYNLLWIFDEQLLASPDAIAEIEAQNYALLKKFGADPGTHNVDRVLRLVGTPNLPDKKKRARGRETSLAKLVDIYTNDPPALSDLADWVPPVAPPAKSESKAKELDIDMGAVDDCAEFDDLPADLRTRFAAALSSDPAFAQLWSGDVSILGADKSGSGFAFALAKRLKLFRSFTPTEFGQLLRVWDHSSADKKIDARYIERAWKNSPDPVPSGEDEFHPLADRWVAPFDVDALPRREFVFGRFTAKRYVSVLVAPAGVGKTTFLLMMAVAVVTGRKDITGFEVPRRQRVFLFNQEDELDELKRRLLAVMRQFDVSWSDLLIDGTPGFVMESGAERALIFALKNGNQVVATKAAAAVEDFIKANNIGMVIFDPFVEMHAVDENNNVEIAAVGRVFRRIAVSGSCSVVLAHHPRKPPNAANRESYAGDMDATRGAGALTGVTRMGATLYGIDTATAKKYGIKEDEKHRYVRFDDGKANMSLLSGEPRFFRREGVLIDGIGGDEVGVLLPVKLDRVKSSTDTRAADAARTQDAVVALLRQAADRRLGLTSIADSLLDTGVVEQMSQDTLRKQLSEAFKAPLVLENGDTIRCETARVKGKPGRSAQLVLEIAEGSK